jgi:hypothetical protein
VTTSKGSKSIVNACYMGGANDVGFTDPVDSTEVAVYDIAPFGPAGSDHRYEGPGLGGASLTPCASDRVHDLPPVQTNGSGFGVCRVGVCRVGGLSADINLDHPIP